MSLPCSPCLLSSQHLSIQKVSWGQWSDGWRDVLISSVHKHPRSLVSDLLCFPHLPGEWPLPRPLHGEAERRGVPPPELAAKVFFIFMDRVYSETIMNSQEKNKRQKPMIPIPPAHVTCESTQILPHPQTHVPTEAHDQDK